MPWSGITAITTLSAGNALPISGPSTEPLEIITRHPGTGPSAILTLYAADGSTIGTITVSKDDPIQSQTFFTDSATINYSTDAALDSPGLSVQVGREIEIGPAPAPLATILATVPAANTRAIPTDYVDGLLVSTGTKWIGFLGTFANFAALGAVSKTNIGQGATAALLDGTEYSYSGTAWVATSLIPLPSGGYSLAGELISDYQILTLSAKDVKAPLELISGSAYPTICVGSSTTEQYTSANLPTDKPQEATDGVFGCVQQVYGSPFHVIRGGFRGIGGTMTGPLTTSDTVLSRLQSGLALAGVPKWVIFQPRGNDDISTDEGVAQLTRYVEQGIQMCIAAGAKVFLIKQHLKITTASQVTQYVKSNAQYDLLARRFFGHVFVVDHYSKIMLPDGATPNPALLDVTGVHLNAAGVLAVVPAWEKPLREAMIYPDCFRPIDPRSLPAANSILNTNPLFEDEATGLYSSTGWTGIASYSTIAQGPDDIFGRKSIRLTQIAGQTSAYLRQTYTPSGAQCVARAVALFTPRQNVGEVGLTVRNSSASWSISLMAAKRGADRIALENGRTYIYASAPFLVDPSFFAANSQFNAIIAPATADASTLAIADVSGLALIKIADSWT